MSVSHGIFAHCETKILITRVVTENEDDDGCKLDRYKDNPHAGDDSVDLQLDFTMPQYSLVVSCSGYFIQYITGIHFLAQNSRSVFIVITNLD